MVVWLVAGWLGGPAQAAKEDVLTRCGHEDLLAELAELDDKQRRKLLFDRAALDVARERFTCAAELTKYNQVTTKPRRPADVRRLDEMVSATAEFGYARQGMIAMRDGDFETAEGIFRRLAAIGHVRSLKTLEEWKTLDRRGFLYSKAREAMLQRRPRRASARLKLVEDGWKKATIASDLSYRAVEALRVKIDAAVVEDESLADREAEEGVSCWTTLTGPLLELKQLGGCPEGASEVLRDLHESDVATNRAKYSKGPVNITTEHPPGSRGG